MRAPRADVCRAGMVIVALVSATVTAAGEFARDIQPLLARRCFSCHGPDTQEAGLRLDERAVAVAALDSGSRERLRGGTLASPG